MSFVITRPEAIAAAARNLQAIDAAMTAQNAAAATPTAGVVPAAADEVSALQATQFAAYGKLYQQVSAQAAAIQQMFIHTLRTSADSYDATESANAAANSLAQADPSGVAGQGGLAGLTQVSNFGSAASDLLQLGSSGFLAPGALTSAQAAAAAAPASAVLTSSTEPGATAGSGAAPVLVNAGQSAAAGKVSVPPNWAGPAAAAGTPPAATSTVAQAGTAGPGPSTAAVPAGLASAAAGERGSQGRLRYGVKPKVAPRATGV